MPPVICAQHRISMALVIWLLTPPHPLPAADAIPGVGPKGEVRKVHGGFGFTEGPAADDHGNLFFTDVPNSKIFRVDSAGMLSLFRDNSNNGNGLMHNAQGELLACEMGGRVVAISPDGKTARPLAEGYHGTRFNAPNDLVLDRAGGVYFTDPAFRAPMPLPQSKTAVYYVSAQSEVTRLIDDLPNPNGVILSPDEKTLYVIPSGQAEMMAYPIDAPGKLAAGRVFCKLAQPASGGGRSGGDGLTVDTAGRLYITSALGVQVFDAQGKLLGTLEFPEQPSNATFGGPGRHTLYVTARTSVYAVELEAQGHVFRGPAK